MLLAELVDVTATVAATRSRRQKTEALAGLLDRLGPDDVLPAIGLLIGSPRQGRLGVGWRGIATLQVPHADAASLTIADLDSALGGLAAASGPGSAGVREGLLREIAGRATTEEWGFITRAILGELRTGALQGVLLDAIAQDVHADAALVRRAAMLSGDLGETAALALAGADLTRVGLQVGRPVQPMLAASATSVAEAVAITGEASVEYKLDGARIQVHRHGDDVRVYTRSLADITHRVPEIVAAVRELPVHDVILDGETLSLGEDGTPRPFQDTMARFGADRARHIALRPWFFDVLHVDGRDLIDEPLRVRLRELERVAGAWRVPGIVTGDADAAQQLSAQALAAGHEGVVVKAIDAGYAAGRRGKAWIKVKPVLSYDLVVLACEWGSGRRRGWLSNLHLGARDPDGRYGEPGGFVMVGKTFKGLTDEVLRWQTTRFEQIETRRTAGTVFVAPITVVEIAIDGVQRSPRYPAGIALRFARVKGYRPDKSAAEADTIQTLQALRAAADVPDQSA
ncbi:ATP-dependent DNA ligase [Microbacterium protaetiae]|uniref:DNA ligase n=1 Tax=Microbacterium protaetiae TaxID=2509458 RepID=A0A4P6ELC7_9MICO|nr:ATP-dependent DNA ligase [Microbacterium protaetiae]QAY58618.1 ATP-dependent DNA ligase [Microbacterium protaetiae]